MFPYTYGCVCLSVVYEYGAIYSPVCVCGIDVNASDNIVIILHLIHGLNILYSMCA